MFTRYYKFESCYEKDDDTFVGIVTDYKVSDGKISITLKAKEVLIVNYSYNNLVFDKLLYGDKLLVKGELYTPMDSTIFNSFSYKDYLYNRKIFYIVKASSINKIENNSNYFYTLKNVLYDRVNKLKSGNYIKTLLFGDNNLSSDIKDSYRINGISHLFSISGMHINLIIGILYIYLDRITYNKYIKYLISFSLILFYDKYKNKNYFIKVVYTSVISFLVSFPITVFYFYEVNVFSIIINVLIVPIVSVILIPLAIITLFFPICDSIMFFFTSILEDISFFLNDISFMRFIFCKPSIIIVILYKNAIRILFNIIKENHLVFVY